MRPVGAGHEGPGWHAYRFDDRPAMMPGRGKRRLGKPLPLLKSGLLLRDGKAQSGQSVVGEGPF